MAWRCHGATNAELITKLHSAGLIQSSRVLEAMNKVDRAKYVLKNYLSEAYQDRPQPIGHGATISAPHMHASALENLLPFLKPGARVLDVGSGSGYVLACMYHLISSPIATGIQQQAHGFAIGIEHIPELAKESIENLKSDGLDEPLVGGSIKVVAGDGRNPSTELGCVWDAIHVGAAAPTMPSTLVNQLASPGRMFIPVGIDSQAVFQVDKDEKGEVTIKELYNVRYVPLTSREAQLSGV
ncbi:protein-L-isoaspartate O-methyltransferase [Melampsora americana]|nr:protein-L-isoaspartate O-methyltransferase [Melampsora americana]